VDNVETFNDIAENNVAAVEPRGLDGAQEELEKSVNPGNAEEFSAIPMRGTADVSQQHKVKKASVPTYLRTVGVLASVGHR
jgi:hypothetical protein